MKNHLFFIFFVLSLLESNASIASDDITAVVGIEDAEGVTQKDFSLDFLRAIENQTVALMKLRVEENLKSKGFLNTKIEIVPSSTYLEVGGRKLAIVKLRHPSYATNQVFVFGIVGRELRKVMCTRQSTEQISLSYGSCSKKIEEAYGIKLLK